MAGLIAALTLFLYGLNLSLQALWLEQPADCRDRRSTPSDAEAHHVDGALGGLISSDGHLGMRKSCKQWAKPSVSRLLDLYR
jgi:hypothetical protein